MIPDSAVLQRVPTVVATDMGQTVVLLDGQDGYLELNPIGSSIWDNLVEPITLGALVVMLSADFGVSASTIKRDVVPFVETLGSRKFITIR